MSYHLYSYVLNQEKLKLNELISKWLLCFVVILEKPMEKGRFKY